MNEALAYIEESIKKHNLSRNGLQKLVFDKTGVFLSPATIDRIFAKDKKSKGFNYSKTIDPILRALATLEDNPNAQRLYDIELMSKSAEIEELNRKIEELTEKYEKEYAEYRRHMDELRGEYQRRIDYVRHQNDDFINHLTDQIHVKDRRIDAKDEMIKELQEKLNHCKNCNKCLQSGEQ